VSTVEDSSTEMTRDRTAIAGDIELAYGKTVSRLRRRMGLGQEAFAHKANINRTYITDIELGRRSVGIRITQKICQALGVSLVEFAVELTNQVENIKRQSQ
jgi:transcriptional regulator with XRE-family HTH domain